MQSLQQSKSALQHCAVISGRRRGISCRILASPPGQQQACDHEKIPPQIELHQPASAPQSMLAQYVAHPSTFVSALAGFALISSSIFPDGPALHQMLAPSAAQAAGLPVASDGVQGAGSAVLQDPSSSLLQLDGAIHLYVASHTTESFRIMADWWISDAFITAGIFGWVLCTAACLLKAPSPKVCGVLGLAWAFYYTTCGAVGRGDPFLVAFLKDLFARVRPSSLLHHTYSFPSGHTSAAVFIVGALLTVLLPLTLQLSAAEQQSGSVNNPNPTSNSLNNDHQGNSQAASSQAASGSWAAGALVSDVVALGIWAAAWGTTASGRILSESHWLSDTMAGGLLALASVSCLACSSSWLQAQEIGSSQSSESTKAAASTDGAAPVDS